MDKPITRAEYLTILLARQGKEASRARLVASYGDPAKVARYESEGKIKQQKNTTICMDMIRSPHRLSEPAMKLADHAAIIESAPERESPFNIVMGIWARWMRLPDVPTTRGDSNLQDTKEFMTAGEAVDVMVGDLPRVCWWAVHKSRGLNATVWRFPDTSMADALEQAEEKLIPKMRQHIALKRYFD